MGPSILSKKNHPYVWVIALNTNTGFAVANNMALWAIETPHAALLNNDAVPDSQWLQQLVYALETHPEAGFAASKMLFYDTPAIGWRCLYQGGNSHSTGKGVSGG